MVQTFKEYLLESKITLAQVNNYLKSKGVKEKLVKGRGYYYFQDGNSHRWKTSSVFVNDINQLSLEQWYSEWKDLNTWDEEWNERGAYPHIFRKGKK